MSERSAHWENIYLNKQPHEVSWTQDVPETSLKLITTATSSKNDPIIDVGAGDSKLVDHLLDLGYTDITVLDISKYALKRAQERLGDKANLVHWIHADITDFIPERSYAVWHDRAVFHFLTDPKHQAHYKQIVGQHVDHSLIVGSFSTEGPLKCSGLEIVQYDEDKMRQMFQPEFNLTEYFTEDHQTPFNTVQNFQFSVFNRD